MYTHVTHANTTFDFSMTQPFPFIFEPNLYNIEDKQVLNAFFLEAFSLSV